MIKPKPIVLAVVAMIVALAGATAAYAATRGDRTARAIPPVNLVAAARGCAVVHIALHGTRPPTITCLHRTWPARQAGNKGDAIYRTSYAPCNGAENFFINAYTAQYCFTGSGYLPLSPKAVLVLYISAQNKSWVRLYYNSVGSFFNVPGGGGNEYFQGPSGKNDAQNVTLTQVCDACNYHS
jgi:hypothetical protein